MRIVVTGGTGSLGRAFLRRLAAQKPAPIGDDNNIYTVPPHYRDKPDVGVMFSRDELKQAQVMESLGYPDNIRACIGDVRDPDRLRVAFRGADVVIHAAALKRVDAVAMHADETVKTNIVGSVNVFRAAMDCGVPKVLLISSDKAVLPTNSYGASKQMAEWVATGFNTYSVPAGTRIATIRYGNVLGSRGSVVHIWRKALREGRSLPLTNPDATRFVITMDQALTGISEALRVMQGGEIFVPKLGWCYVRDIGLAMVSGGETVKFETVGLRPGGEKIHEQLLSDDERHRCGSTEHAYVVVPHIHSWGIAHPWVLHDPAQIPEYVSGNPQLERATPRDLAPLIAAVPEEGLF